MQSEADVQARIMLACGGLPGTRLFRNHVGSGWTGQFVGQEGDLTLLRNARRATFGLAPGSADLVGWRREVVGNHVIARLVSLEIKTASGRPTAAQETWLRRCLEAGALAGVVRSPEEALALLRAEGDKS